MHSYSGLMAQLFALWFDPAYADERYSIKKYQATIENMFAVIRLPSRYTRNVRSYKTDGAHYKAHEWLVIGQYVICSVLASFLPQQVLQNVLLYTESVFKLYSKGMFWTCINDRYSWCSQVRSPTY
jgi:hypothetical protein